MKSILQSPAPNVQPGTDFNIRRFDELYNWIAASMADAIRLSSTQNQHGLIYNKGEKNNLILEIEGHTLRLRECWALTPAGTPIFIKEGETITLKYNLLPYLQSNGTHFSIFLVANTQKRYAFGQPDLEEIPRRQPFSLPQYHLELHANWSMNTFNFLEDAIKIGELVVTQSQFRLKTFRPICAQLGATTELWRTFQEHRSHLTVLYRAVLNILKKLAAADQKRDVGFHQLLTHLGAFLAERKRSIISLNEQSSPQFLIEFWMQLADLFQFHLSTTIHHAELLRYIGRHVDFAAGIRFNPNEFRNVIEEVANAEYRHENQTLLFAAVNRFINQIRIIFDALKEVNEFREMVEEDESYF